MVELVLEQAQVMFKSFNVGCKVSVVCNGLIVVAMNPAELYIEALDIIEQIVSLLYEYIAFFKN